MPKFLIIARIVVTDYENLKMKLSLLFYRPMAPPCVLPLLLSVLTPLVLPIDDRSVVKKRSIMGAGATWPDEVYTTWMAAYKVC